MLSKQELLAHIPWALVAYLTEKSTKEKSRLLIASKRLIH